MAQIFFPCTYIQSFLQFYRTLQPKQQAFAPKDPITHPLYGTAPAQSLPYNNGYPDANQPPPFNQQPVYGQQPPVEPPKILQPTAFPQPQSFNNQPFNAGSYNPPTKPAQQNVVNAVVEKPQAVEKQPIPEEHVVLQSVFDDLRSRCSCAASNPVSSFVFMTTS